MVVNFAKHIFDFRNIDDYEACNISVDESYDAEDTIFIVYIYKINTPQLNLINRSEYGNGFDFKHRIEEYRGDNCYIPSNG